MYFNSINEINQAVVGMPTIDDGKRKQYPVLFKKAVCEFLQRKNMTPGALSHHVHMTAALINKWCKQYEDGLYTLKGTYNVSKKSLTTNDAILKKLNTEVNLIQRKIELVKQCAELGIVVNEGSM